ncbi:MAG: LuxR C-terminal-related transcriptional regulator, partial [Thermomicrobiales bacterium]
HLLAMIDQPFRARVTLIVAGAGYGKTILATELATHRDEHVGWLTCSTEDNDEHALIEDLRIALRPCLRRGRFLRADLTDDHALLARDLADVEQGACLVLDNCELLTNPQSHRMLEEVIAGLPEGCSIVLVSRTPPPIPLGKLRASGMIRELGPSQLQFTRSETVRFLAGLPDVSLEPDEVVLAHQFTQGWVVGLYLVSVAARAHAMTLLTSQDRLLVLHQFLDEYVQQELLSPLSESARTFLLETAEIPTLTAEICDCALEITDAQDRIVALAAEFPFLTPLAGSPHHWSLPRLIRESLLRITGARFRRADVSPRQRAVLALLLERGSLHDAAEFAMIGGDPEWMASAVHPWCEHLALRSDFEPLDAVLERLPQAVIDLHPDFAYWRAIAHLGIARHISVLAWFPPVERAWMRSGDPLLRGRALTCRALIAWLAGRHPEVIAAADEALATLPSTAVVERMYAATTKARILFREGDDDGAAMAIHEAERCAMSLPLDEQWAWRTLAMDRANAYALRGDLHSAVTKYRLIIAELPASLQFLEGFYRCRLLSIAIEMDQMDVARHEYAHIERLLEGEWRLWHFWAILARARLLIAEGNMAEAEAWAARHVKVLRRMPGKSQLVMQLARVWLHHGEYAMVRSWLDDLRELPFPWIDAFGEISHLQLQVDLDLAEGRFAAATDLARSLSQAAAAKQQWAEFIVFSVRWALADALRVGKRHQAILPPTVVERGDRGGFVRAYRVPGFDTTPMIEAARDAMAAGPQHPAPTPVPSSPNPLTRREFEVLGLVARGRTNQQIADDLFISVNTVRNHLVHICRRLDASSRVEAVARARDLGLLA